MKRLTRTEKVKRLNNMMSILWNSYEHIYTVRIANAQNAINFLLVTISFLPVISISLYTEFKSPLFLLPLFPQAIALLILLKSFFVRGIIPWFTTEGTIQTLEEDKFEADTFASLKASETESHRMVEIYRSITKKGLFMLVFSIYMMILSGIFYCCQPGLLLYVLTAVLSLVFVMVYFLYYKNMKESTWGKDREDNLRLVENWLNNDKQ